MKNLWVAVFLCFPLLLTTACFPILDFGRPKDSVSPEDDVRYPPLDLDEESLVGEWQQRWKEGHFKERLVLIADRTYEYTYEVPKTKYRYDARGKWWIEEMDNGCLYLHLEGARYYHGTREIAESGNRRGDGTPEMFIDRCDLKTVTMPGFLLLLIGKDPAEKERAAFYHMLLDLDSTDKLLVYSQK